MMDKECFAYKNGRCKALKVQQCEGVSCGFFKTTMQVTKAQQDVFSRIKAMDDISRKHIMDLYYGGKMSLLDELEVD